jgi:hypothetical protein
MTSNVDIETIVNDLILLELKGRGNRVDSLFEPFSFDFRDIIDIQRATKRIANHAGLLGYTFIVTVENLPDGQGGEIELKPGQTLVPISVSRDIAENHSALLATLAHEVSHQYLLVNDISLGEGSRYIRQNEILTDVTSVFLGFGKLMMNGCHHVEKWESRSGNTTYTHTSMTTTGYLKPEEFAFAYLTVCAIRGISLETCLPNLSDTAQKTLALCRKDFSTYLSFDGRDIAMADRIVDEKNGAITDAKFALAQIDIYYRELKRDLDAMSDWLKENHRILQSFDSPRFAGQETQALTHLRLLRMIFNTKNHIRAVSSASESKGRSMKQALVALRGIADGSSMSMDERTSVCCHLCGQKISLPTNRTGSVICPGCKYEFVANTKPSGTVAEKKVGAKNQSVTSLLHRLFRRS